MIASLPMYWRDENAGLWRAFWREVQARIDLPDLTPPDALPDDWTDHWLDPELVLSMTCGLPLRTALKDKVAYVGTLGFGLNCREGYYFSHLIAGTEPFGDSIRLAYSASDSQSGWAARFDEGPDNPPLNVGDCFETGSHAASLAAVAEGRADAAYIDAVTWRILRETDPNAAQVRLAGRTPPRPGLPLIAARHIDVAPLREALAAATRAFVADRPMLMGGTLGFHVLDETLYHDQPVPPPPPALHFPQNPA
ncbi:MAG: PhnD/SsuA/transferrin family substrate-binding protein [Silicimonas sp.]|nr:PhnD/SsuA/transferrin family substrate-binding protein [Silicimonas sp.]